MNELQKVQNQNIEVIPQAMTVENRLEIIEEGIRKKYLARLGEMEIAPVPDMLPLEDDLVDNVRLFRITEMVYQKGELATDKFTTVLNTCFTTSVAPEKGIYGVQEVLKDTGILERTWRNEAGCLTREYFRDGKIFQSRSKGLDGNWVTSKYDDNGTAYLRETTVIGKNIPKGISIDLVPNTEVVKGNFTAIIDEFGRPVMNKIHDLTVKENMGRENLSDKLKDSSYLDGDERGHIIADIFDGPASKENIVPQGFDVNRSQMKAVENLVKKLKAEGHTVDYEVKTNYVGSDKRPSSFEPKITVDGKPYELSKDMKKIYNTSESSLLSKAKTTVGEKVGLHHEAGMEAGMTAAAITCAVSTVDNVSKFMDGEISAEEMVVDIAKDTGVAGAVGYGSAFVSSAVAQGLKNSSHELLKSVGKAGVPAAVVAFGVTSYDCISDFAQGEIDGMELAYDLGDNAASVAGGMLGTIAVASVGAAASAAASAATGAKVGAIVGSVIPGAGTAAGAVAGGAVGFGISVVGGMVGTAIASEAYMTAVEFGSAGVDILADKVQEVASNTVEKAKIEMPDSVNDIKNAINSFASVNKIPIHV